MSQTALPDTRPFDAWARLTVGDNKQLLLTTAPDTEHELWSALEYYSEVEEVGLDLIQAKGLQSTHTYQEIFNCFQAFVRQAKSYYSSAKTLHYRSSSLLYYYSFLNLVKAYLLLIQPQRIMGQAVYHGLSYNPSTTNTDFQLEIIGVHQGAFPMFYEAQTSSGISTAANSSLNIVNLLSYPTEISHQYRLAYYGYRNILSSIASVAIDRPNNQSWIILGIPAEASLNGFLSLHVNFLQTYQEVEIDINQLALVFVGMSLLELSTFRFFQELTITPTPAITRIISRVVPLQRLINDLSPYISTHYFDDNKDFDLVLPYTDTTRPTPIPITEALAIYAVMFYLSSLVRYRPDYLESLLNTKPAWLIENFVTSAPETFLRIMVSKIIGIDYIFRRR
jgi:YaaC-like Protein